MDCGASLRKERVKIKKGMMSRQKEGRRMIGPFLGEGFHGILKAQSALKKKGT